jgi:hypothetical protein
MGICEDEKTWDKSANKLFRTLDEKSSLKD